MAGATLMVGHTLRRMLTRWFDADEWLMPARGLLTGPEHVHLRRAFACEEREVAERRVAIFRDHVGDRVMTVSPLLLRACAIEELAPDALARLLRPHLPWILWLCGSAPMDMMTWHYSGRQVPRPDPARVWVERFAHGGFVVRDPPGYPRRRDGGMSGRERRALVVRGPVGPLSGFGVRVLDAGFEMAALLGEHRVRTHGGTGSITVRMPLPETVRTAAAGMPLDRLISHPLLDGAGCVVTEIEEPTGWGTKVAFALEPVAWTMPWCRHDRPGPAARDANRDPKTRA